MCKINIYYTISDTALGTVNNTATVSSSTLDPNPNNNTSSVSVNVQYADLVAPGNFVKITDKQYADVGEEITYTLNVTNTGNTIANNVVITDPIPNGTSYVNGSLSADVLVTGTPAGGINVIGGIVPGQTITLSYRVKVDLVPVPNPIPNTASVSYTYTVDPSNPNGASGSGNTNTVTTQVNHGEILPENAVKTADKTVTTPGDIVTYTITVKNTGNVPVVLSNVQASCGCTTPEWKKDPIMPGAKTTIKVGYSTQGRPGAFNKTITVTSNAENAREVLTIKGSVENKPGV